jgi:murein DD-endopeptidase MepM/ murein hydrolase activator NlpD
MVVVLAALASAGGPARAQSQTTGLERREELEDLLAESSQEELRVAAQLATFEAELARLGAQLTEVQARLVESERALTEAEAEVERTSAYAAAVASQLVRTNAELEQSIALIRDQAVSAFMSGGSASTLNNFLALDDLRDIEAALAWTDAVVEHQDGVVRDITRLRDEVERLSIEAERARQAANAAQVAATGHRDAVEAERETVDALRGQAEAAAGQQSVLLAGIQSQRLLYEAELAALAAVSSSIAAALQAAQSGQTATAATRGTFAVPIPTARLSSGFGPRVHPIFGNVRVHAGLDLSAPSGTPIAAAGDGVVVAAGVRGGYGNAVVIDHGNALATLYGHQSRIAVTVGQQVRQGDIVGLVGSTGNSTGPHLHFEVRLFGTPVDPLAYL